MKLRDNLFGKKFGRLLVLERTFTRRRGVYWTCLCDCGRSTIVRSDVLKSGRVSSCGCYASDLSRNRVQLPTGVAAFNRIFNRYKCDAVNRGLEFELSKCQFKEITERNCAYCGVEPTEFTPRKPKDGGYENGSFVGNGLDRFYNEFGYNASNCVACCDICNRAKNDLTPVEWNDYCSRLTKFRSGL